MQCPLHAGPQQRVAEHAPLWQSAWSPHTLESGHLTRQFPPHLLLKSLGVQHLLSTHASYLPQSASVVHLGGRAAAGSVSDPSVITTTVTATMSPLGRITVPGASVAFAIHICLGDAPYYAAIAKSNVRAHKEVVGLAGCRSLFTPAWHLQSPASQIPETG